MKKIIVLLLIAAVSLVAALTTKRSGFLDLSNIVRCILFSVSVACALIAAILAIRKMGGGES